MPMLELAGAQLNYELIEGDPTKPLMVFLHEGLGCIGMWKEFPERLCAATGCAGLVYERQGYGRSSPQPALRSIHYLHQFALVELPALMERLAPGREHIVVGHSDGGSIALIYAAARPPGLRGVITAAAHVFVEDVTIEGIHIVLAAHSPGKMRALARYHGEKAEQVFSSWADTWLAPWFRQWNIEYLLPAIACPLLAMQGSDDHYGSAAQLDAIEGGTPGARQLLLPGCGHSPHIEQPETTLQAMATFINLLVT
ncbi:Lysophospholipase, alpha-beta hydrolase superfamily [Duganella sp. CF458]|uniref:alpha/beta fold hydrolase n=1 Tax=Duganella sp. CF458 TaxID=1884368 RepID=UPI0008F1C2E6|nr:alpha/beta hydrolase [Duganella sp. CF458]SFG93161.1 Lysophospholipase, alpha-beta hydrolase superfamily [Duganella sp. CF458]